MSNLQIKKRKERVLNRIFFNQYFGVMVPICLFWTKCNFFHFGEKNLLFVGKKYRADWGKTQGFGNSET